ncbi:DUF92 domain-containing protein [bacterium]|nr:DUF92 domain-containing protein [bacterium]
MTTFQSLFHAPLSDWIRFAAFFTGILLLIVLLETIRARTHWSQEVTRKILHIGVGLFVVMTPCFFQTSGPIIWIALIFIILNYLAIRSGRLKSMHGVGRISYGTVFFPLSVLILLILCWETGKHIFMIAVLTMTVPDALAAIVGENLKNPHVYRLGSDQKSLEGSITMFFSTFGCVMLILTLLHGPHDILSAGFKLWIAFATAGFATALESVSTRGSDNLTVPLGTAFLICSMLNGSGPENLQLALGFGLALIIGLISLKIGFLNLSGSVGTFILAIIVFGTGGWAWTIPILTFFILSSVLSKTGKTHKKHLETVFEKTDRRDIGQVLANGGLPGVLVILFHFNPSPVWYFAYLGALASVNADTWGTEIGVLSRVKPRLITSWKIVAHGTSGGVTPSGIAGALFGSVIIGLSGLVISPEGVQFSLHRPVFIWVVAAGFCAALLDSLLGATLQGQFECRLCRHHTEKREHCGQPAVQISGKNWINNDCVNLFCALFGVFFVIFGCICGIC